MSRKKSNRTWSSPSDRGMQDYFESRITKLIEEFGGITRHEIVSTLSTSIDAGLTEESTIAEAFVVASTRPYTPLNSTFDQWLRAQVDHTLQEMLKAGKIKKRGKSKEFELTVLHRLAIV